MCVRSLVTISARRSENRSKKSRISEFQNALNFGGGPGVRLCWMALPPEACVVHQMHFEIFEIFEQHTPQEATLSSKGVPQAQQNCGDQKQILKHANAPHIPAYAPATT